MRKPPVLLYSPVKARHLSLDDDRMNESYNNFLTQCLISEMIVPEMATRTEKLSPVRCCRREIQKSFFFMEKQ
jgi:hypothetical protein